MLIYLLCAGAGGFIGASLRTAVGLLVAKFTVSTFPFATLLVNVTGSFLIGLLLCLPQLQNPNLKAFLTAGILGGLTTFSTFTYDNLNLLHAGNIPWALLNMALNLLLSLFACYLGTLCIRLWN